MAVSDFLIIRSRAWPELSSNWYTVEELALTENSVIYW
jgi:hypothetical protein